LSSSATLLTENGRLSPSVRDRRRWLQNRLVAVALWIALVGMSVAVVGFLLTLATNRFDFSEPKLKESLKFSGTQLDVAFFGDSLTLEGVNPEVIDQNLRTQSYNFALGGASILESEMQLRYFLRHNPKPRLVALGIYLNIPNKPVGARPTLYFELPSDLKTRYRSELLTYEGVRIDRSFTVFNHVPAYRYRNTIDLIVKSLLSRDDQRPSFVKGQARVAFFREPYLGREHESVFRADELESFIRFCQEQQIPLVLFEPPNHPGYSDLTSNRTRILDDVSRLVAKYRATRFLSYNGPSFSLPKKDWVNLNHLNTSGSIKFTKLLSNMVAEEIAANTR
jgi:hypothetical protein